MPISTGYTPQFALGALYQGFNAANADSLGEEELLKAFLANQREQQSQPLDQAIKTWEAAHAQDKLSNPEYRQKMLEGYIGQMNSQIAAGKKAMETNDSDIEATNQENKNKQIYGNLLERFRTEQMSPYQEPTPILSDDGSQGFNFGSAENALQNPNLTSEQKQLILQDIKKSGNPVNKLQNVLVNTPDHLQKLDLYNNLNQGRLDVAEVRNQGLGEAARIKAQQITKDPNLQQVLAKAFLISSGTIPATDEQIQAARELLLQHTNKTAVERSAGVQPGISIPETQSSGKIVQQETPYTQFAKDPNLFFNFSRRKQVLDNKKLIEDKKDLENGVVAKGSVSSGKTFTIKKQD